MLGDQAQGLGLVARVRVGVQEHHGDRSDAARDEMLDAGEQLGAVEGLAHAAVGLQALVDLEPQIARHQRLGLGDVEVVELELPLAADLERVKIGRAHV